MKKAVFLDRDGTINVEKHYLYKPEDFEFLPGVIDGLKRLQDHGYLLVIITNQSGIARGYYTESDFHKLNDYMLTLLEKRGIHIAKVYYCPHLPNGSIEGYRKECECRKPRLGMFYKAKEDFDIDMSKSWAVGDKFRDIEISKVSDCKGVLLSTNLNIGDRNNSGKYFQASNFVEAVNIIMLNS